MPIARQLAGIVEFGAVIEQFERAVRIIRRLDQPGFSQRRTPQSANTTKSRNWLNTGSKGDRHNSSQANAFSQNLWIRVAYPARSSENSLLEYKLSEKKPGIPGN